MSTTVIHRYRLDDLRRFAAALGAASGLVPLRALTLASHLLWFDTAGASVFGMSTLPEWLEAIASGRVDAGVVGKVSAERAALAIFDGQNGVPPLMLGRAAELAVEKARETGFGLVRVAHVGPVGSTAAVAAGIAVEPKAGLVIGPGGSWSLAWPSALGLPVVIDSALAGDDTSFGKPDSAMSRAGSPRHANPALPPPLEGLATWAEMLAPKGSWLVAAVSVADLEPLTTFHERLDSWLRGLIEAPGRLLPASWDSRRREVAEHGIAFSAPVWKKLKQWAQRLSVLIPEPGDS